ncbi:MAG: hypothetical protein GVY24_03745 [Planctomycetes bacterium]|jgi:tRNA modification GTPase|nr:hypothetical protein [Planctomycetota bacterium]
MPRAPDDTIAAVSSPPGRSYRGLIRLSGAAAVEGLNAILATPARDDASHTLQAVRLADPPIPALLTVFRGPRSYTGEDVLELQVPGNAALLERLLHQLTAAGARLAEPGEFTFRAYVNGRLDLTRAEGVAATIRAESDAQLNAANLLRDGKLAEASRTLVDDLGQALALVEAGIDFVDQEDVVPITAGDLRQRVAGLHQALDALLRRSRSWGALDALPRVVLVGPPSCGKSTLFNALLGHERAVIHDLPGTTRDVLAEPMKLPTQRGMVEVMLVDVAGLDAAEALLDREAQAAARRAIDAADLLLLLGESPLTLPESTPTLRLEPKADVVEPRGVGLPISAVTGHNLDALRERIAQHIGQRGVSAAGDALALQPRHEAALREARDQLAAAGQLLDHETADALTAPELIAGRLRAALDALASLGGELTPDDVIGKVFATFCVGK